jgi:hypothetical protein
MEMPLPLLSSFASVERISRDCGLRICREKAQKAQKQNFLSALFAPFGGESSFHYSCVHYRMDWEKVTTHGGYDLRFKNGVLRPRKEPCKDWVKAALAQKKQKCKSENSLPGRREGGTLQLRIADCGLRI